MDDQTGCSYWQVVVSRKVTVMGDLMKSGDMEQAVEACHGAPPLLGGSL